MVQSRMKYFIEEKAQFLGLFHIRSFFLKKKGKLCNFVEKIAKLMQSIIMVDFPFLVYTVVFYKPSPKKSLLLIALQLTICVSM